MRVQPGTMITFPIANGVPFPGVVISEQEVRTSTKLQDGVAVEIRHTHADVISRRTTLAGEVYLALSNETIEYRSKPIARPRFTKIEGLDVIADKPVSLDRLIDLQLADYSAFAAAKFAGRGAVNASDV